MLQIANSKKRDSNVSGGISFSTNQSSNLIYQNVLESMTSMPSGTSLSHGAFSQTVLRSIIGIYQGPLQNKLSASEIRNIARTVIWTTLTDIYGLLTWGEGWNGYDACAPRYDAVVNADNWIVQFFLEVMDLDEGWIRPNVTASGDGEVILGWRFGSKRLTIYVGEESVEYLKTWGPDINDNMDDGDASLTTVRQALWKWLVSY